jgi:predicted dehydrogenase
MKTKMRSLIIGMGIGKLYKNVLESIGHEVITVDTNPSQHADYTNLSQALSKNYKFDTTHICTPNFTHEPIALEVVNHTRILFIEKPGLSNSDAWDKLVEDNSNTRIVMVKNNQYRDNIEEIKQIASASVIVDINWINEDRVPSPGSWFTNRELAWGGVSRDLMPHLLSIWCILDPLYYNADRTRKEVKQRWSLKDLTSTSYGTAYPDGVYDVDDYCRLGFLGAETMWTLTADWRSLTPADIGIYFQLYTGHKHSIPLGLCPESAYKTMIITALKNIDNQEFWDNQYFMDSWIHSKIEKL